MKSVHRGRRRRVLSVTVAALLALLGTAGFLAREEIKFQQLVKGRFWAVGERLHEEAPDTSVLFNAFILENSRDNFVQQGARLRIIAGLEAYPVDALYALDSTRINSIAWARSGVIVAAGDNGTYTVNPSAKTFEKVQRSPTECSYEEHPTEPMVAKVTSQGESPLFDVRMRQ